VSYLGMKQLLEAGVHFGHETKRWNPKMKRYIFAERNGIFIIDLQKTLVESEKSFNFLRDMAGRGNTILFVGTKKQAQEILAAEARRCGMPFINERWLGGLLTNFKTIRTRVERLKDLQGMFDDESILRFTKKEQISMGKELQRLQRYLGGIRDMNRLPDALFVIDPTKEAIAVKEANKLDIPVVALADTDSDPDVLDFIIPGNDDAIRSIQLVTARLSDVIVEVRGGSEEPVERPAEEAARQAERETLPTPMSSPERTIKAAAAMAEDEEAAAGEPAAKPAPAKEPTAKEPTAKETAAKEAPAAEETAPKEAAAEATAKAAPAELAQAAATEAEAADATPDDAEATAESEKAKPARRKAAAKASEDDAKAEDAKAEAKDAKADDGEEKTADAAATETKPRARTAKPKARAAKASEAEEDAEPAGQDEEQDENEEKNADAES